jgi:hypothetical protein
MVTERRAAGLCTSSGAGIAPHLGVDELDDAGLALEPPQQVDLVHEALRRLGVQPRQPDALQRVHLPLRRNDLRNTCPCSTNAVHVTQM